MRKPAAALLFALLIAFGLGPTVTVEAARSDVKVVIIVGPVEGSTKSYRAKANTAYDEAIKYSSDVTRIYSPNATWSRVKAATVGASIVIYLGHGNGWPSPYTYDPAYRTKDGFGLNAKAGAGNRNVKYYGEPYVASLDLAPNAIVILNQLCYASGNSEPGYGEPSLEVARKRIDNFGAGFLDGAATAVLAEGHGSVAPYIRAIFTTDQSLTEMWRDAPSRNGHVSSFSSGRTPGARAYMDPKRARSGFYRSLVTMSGVTTTDVRTGGSSDPSTASNPTPFTDIGTSKFEADIAWLWETGLTQGCSETRYCPGGAVTRAQIASFLARALDLPTATADHFDDDDGKPHEANINRIAEAGLTLGCGDRRYCPDRVVTRAQLASFLARALDLPATATDHFRDDDGSRHEANIDRLAEADITQGCGTDRYCPGNSLTRGQLAAFFHRAFGG